MWAVMYQVSVDTWRIQPEPFDTRSLARLAMAHWPELLRYTVKRVVRIVDDASECSARPTAAAPSAADETLESPPAATRFQLTAAGSVPRLETSPSEP